MIHNCTDCRLFWSPCGCEKNAEAWAAAKELYPVTKTEARLYHHPMTENEKKRLARINTFARRCQDGVLV
jgi:hypothetical protein